MQDNYSILGLKTGASKDEIKKAYRRLAMQYHPDKNPSPDARQKFIRITEAYDNLMEGKSFSAAFRSAAKPKPSAPAQPAYRTKDQQRHEKMAQMYGRMQQKFREQRNETGTGAQFEEKKKKAYMQVYLGFAFAVAILSAGLVVPLIAGVLSAAVITFPAAFVFAVPYFWKAGRKKMRADMLYGNVDHYSFAELRDYFAKDKIRWSPDFSSGNAPYPD